MIQRITDEVYARLQEGAGAGQSGGEALNGAGAISAGAISAGAIGAGTIGTGTIGTAMRIDGRLADVLAACDVAAAKGLDALCVPQWFVGSAREKLPASMGVATIVGLPGGQTSSFAKYAEAKQAVAAGASVLLIPLNMKYCKADAWESVQADLKDTLTAAKGKAQALVLIEADALSGAQLQRAAKVSKDSGAAGALLSYVTGGRPSAAHIAAVRQAGLTAGIYGVSSDKSAQETYRADGARIFTVNALS